MRVRLAIIVSFLLSPVLGGCSDRPKTYRAAGIVVYADGSPLQDGRIETRSTEQPYTARGMIGRDGRFELTTFKTADGAIAGKHQVLIIQRFSADIDDVAAHARHAAQTRQLDRKYANYGTSGLEISIVPKKDNTNLKLVVE